MRWLLPALLLVSCESKTVGRVAFEASVAPVLEGRCSSPTCHGVAPGAEEAGDVIDWDRMFFRVDQHGRLTDLDAAYETARRQINTFDGPEWSTLLRKPLRPELGGLAHVGGQDFLTTRDGHYRAVFDWIAGEEDGGEVPPPLNEREQLFADTVQPALVSGACASANCHGRNAAVPFRIDPGIGGRFSVAATRANYKSALIQLSLDGVPRMSRLIRKALPLYDGGILHRGGNDQFFSGLDDPRVDAIAAWAEAEAAARVAAPPDETGIVFLRGEMPTDEPFALDVFTPGSRLVFLRADGTEQTLAGADGPVDVRDPAVSPEGDRVVFSVRADAEHGHALRLVRLDTLEAVALTEPAGPHPGGAMVTDRDPAFDPLGHVWFVSTRAGVVADRGRLIDGDLYELDLDTGEVLRRTWTPHIERKPVYWTIGASGGELAFTALRDFVASQARAHSFRFPPNLEDEYHQHFGVTLNESLSWDTRELADGRYVHVVAALEDATMEGPLVIIERNFGPNIPDPTAPPAIAGYRSPVTYLDAEGRFRDPVGLPDGALLATRVDEDGPVVVRITLEERTDGSGPTAADVEVLTTGWDPEPVIARYPGRLAAEPHWDPEATTGVLVHQGLPTIDAILAQLPPTGSRLPREGFVAVRLVEDIPLTPARRRLLPPEETPDGRTSATTVSLGPHGIARVLAELPLAADGTFQAEIPAEIPWRIQGLDADGAALGVTHNRWFYAAPGQSVPQGVPDPRESAVYGRRCAGCHGGADGTPERAFVVADAISGASLTFARFEDQNPRRPLPPTPVGDATRIEVDYVEDIQPIWDRKCASWHVGDGAPAPDLSSEPTTHFVVSYESLHVGFVDAEEGRASRSPLWHEIQKGHGELDDAERRMVARWIDLGAGFVGR